MSQHHANEIRRQVSRRTRRLQRRDDCIAPNMEALEPRLLMSATVLGDKPDLGTQIDIDSAAIRADWFADFSGSGIASAAGSSSSFDNGPRWMVQLDMSKFGISASLNDVTETFDLSGINGRVVRGLGLEGIALVETDGSLSNADTLAYFADSGMVLSVESDQMLNVDSIPNDSRFSSLYGLNNVGQTGGTSDADIDAVEAWNLSVGSSDVVIGVIDTGVDYTHSDLAANMWVNTGEIAGNGIDDDGNGFVDDVHGFDFANNDGDPMDDNNHGTHVAGTIAGVGNNGEGVTGVSWNSKIMALKFLDANGSGFTSDAVRALNYATMMKNNGVNVVATNNSWGGGGSSTSMYNAIRANRDAGILFIAAAGNEGSNNDATGHFPSNYDLENVISVAATDSRDNLASFSNYGSVTVDLAAPGVGILSTITGNRYGSFSGTSMATPHVAGVVALAYSFAPTATMAQVKDAILQGVDSVSSLQGDVATAGRLNAHNTLTILGDSAGTNPDPDPTPPPVVQGDLYEDNDDWFVARDRTEGGVNSPNFGELSDTITITDLDTLDDANDWYRFEVTNTDGASARVNFSHNQGDLDIVVYRADTGEMVGLSDSVNDTEFVSLTGQASGVFYLHVLGYDGAANPDYSLTLTVTPPPAPPVPDVGITFERGMITIEGSDGDDDIRFTSAGAGNVLLESGDFSQLFQGVRGISINGNAGNDMITVATDVVDSRGNSIRVMVDGGDGDDVIQTGNGADMIKGGAGNDTIDARGGNDRIYGEDGDDEIYGGDGHDNIMAGEGNNYVDAGEGMNRISTGTGNDEIHAGSDNDRITDEGGHNVIDAGDGNNTITMRGSQGNDTITTGSGRDRITDNGGDNNIDAGDGHNAVSTSSGNGDDIINTGSGNDRIVDGGGTNAINAGGGYNRIRLSPGSTSSSASVDDNTTDANNANTDSSADAILALARNNTLLAIHSAGLVRASSSFRPIAVTSMNAGNAHTGSVDRSDSDDDSVTAIENLLERADDWYDGVLAGN